MQRSRARERSKAAEKEHRGAGRAGVGEVRGPVRATEQGSRAGDGRKQGRAARLQGRAAMEMQLANGRRGANICQNII